MSHNPKVVDDNRKNNIEAAIVRIMKARKTLGHQALVSEVMTKCEFRYLFTPSSRQIKSCIGDLIGREYMERNTEEAANSYNFLA